MPTHIADLEAALSDNCHRIADLCQIRDAVIAKFDARFAELRDVDEMISVTLRMSEATTLIDAEIELLSRGSKKLMHTLEALS